MLFDSSLSQAFVQVSPLDSKTIIKFSLDPWRITKILILICICLYWDSLPEELNSNTFDLMIFLYKIHKSSFNCRTALMEAFLWGGGGGGGKGWIVKLYSPLSCF